MKCQLPPFPVNRRPILPTAEPVPVSNYVESSNNLKDLKDCQPILQVIGNLVSMMSWMPMLVLTSKLVPKGLEVLSSSAL